MRLRRMARLPSPSLTHPARAPPAHSLWQLIYQTFVFISRSSLSILHLPPIPIRYLPLPTLFQLALLALTSLESSLGYLEASFGENGAIWCTFGLIACEGLAGGSAYVNCFYWLGVEDRREEEGLLGGVVKDPKREGMEKEFRWASCSGSGASGRVPLTLCLCSAQDRFGRIRRHIGHTARKSSGEWVGAGALYCAGESRADVMQAAVARGLQVGLQRASAMTPL